MCQIEETHTRTFFLDERIIVDSISWPRVIFVSILTEKICGPIEGHHQKTPKIRPPGHKSTLLGLQFFSLVDLLDPPKSVPA